MCRVIESNPALVLLLLASSTSMGSEVVVGKSQTTELQSLRVGGGGLPSLDERNLTFAQFDPSAYGGRQLEAARLTIHASAQWSVEVFNNLPPDTVVVGGFVGPQIATSALNSGVSLIAGKVSEIAPPSFQCSKTNGCFEKVTSVFSPNPRPTMICSYSMSSRAPERSTSQYRLRNCSLLPTNLFREPELFRAPRPSMFSIQSGWTT